MSILPSLLEYLGLATLVGRDGDRSVEDSALTVNEIATSSVNLEDVPLGVADIFNGDHRTASDEASIAGIATAEFEYPLYDDLFSFDFSSGDVELTPTSHASSSTAGLLNESGFGSVPFINEIAPATSTPASGDGAGPGSAPVATAHGEGPAVTAVDGAFAAKGGIPGKPGGGGGDGGDGGDSSDVLEEYFSGSADGEAGYDIWLDFKGGGWTVELQDAFIAAADYFTTYLPEGAAQSENVIENDIGGGGRYRGKIIDDLYVTAELATIDGSGGVLGQAGPTAVWTASELTAAGKMEFDVADANDFLAEGLWDDIVTHELMHVLGFGSLWNYGNHNLVQNAQYTGSQALDAYRDAQSDPTLMFIPVETDGGAGTAGSHWDEQALTNELMTGFINTDGDPASNDDNYLSEFSVASLYDLGYVGTYQDYPYDDIFLIG